MLLFLVFLLVCHALSPERRAFEGCIVRTRIALPFIDFRNLLEDKMYFVTHYTFRRYVCRWRHKIRKIAVKILQSVNNRTQCLRESAYYAWLLLTYIVMNTILGRLTLDPAVMHCPSWDDAFVSSSFFCHAPSPERRAFEGCIVRTRIALPFIGRYRPISTQFGSFFFGRDCSFRQAT